MTTPPFAVCFFDFASPLRLKKQSKTILILAYSQHLVKQKFHVRKRGVESGVLH